MILTTIRRTADLDRGVQKEPLHAAFVMGDQEAHRFAVKLVKPSDREGVSLTAAGVQGYFMRADGSTVVIDGEGEGDTAVVILPAACYAVPGRFTLIIRVSMGETIHSVMIADGVVSRSRTDVLIDPGDAVPSLDTLLAQIASLESATRAAQEIVMRDEEAAGSASEYAASAAASAGAAADAAADAKTSAQEAGSSEQSAKAAGDRAASSASNAETAALRAEAAANRAESVEISDAMVAKAVNNYLEENPVESVAVDTTLSKAGKAADAAAVGEKIDELSDEIENKQPKGNYLTSVPDGSITIDKLAESTLDTLSDGIVVDGTSLLIHNKKKNHISAEIKTVATGAEGVLTHNGKNMLDMSDKKFTNKNNEDIAVVGYNAKTGTIVENVGGGNSTVRFVGRKIYVEPGTYYTYSGVYSPGGPGRLLVMAFDKDGAVMTTGITTSDGYYLGTYNGWIFEINPGKFKVDSSVAYIKLGAVWLTTVNGTNYEGTTQFYTSLQLEAGENQTDFNVGYQMRKAITNEVMNTQLVPGDNALYADVEFSVQYNPYAASTNSDLQLDDIKDYVTPQMYGAVADGFTDDTAAIQAALDHNRIVFFPEGTYLITSALSIDSGRVLFSHNAETATIKVSGCDAIHLKHGATSGMIKNIGFEGDSSDHYCILFDTNVGWTFDHIRILYFGNSFFYADFCGTITNIYITGGTFLYGGADCVHFQHIISGDDETGGGQVNNIVIDKCLIEYFVTGITITGTAIAINENVIEECDYGIVVDTSLTTAKTTDDINYAFVYGMAITSNYFERIMNNCLYVNAFSEAERQAFGFISGINITGNYMRLNEVASPDTACIKFSRSEDLYDIHSATAFGHEIDGVFCYGNAFVPFDAYIIDCGNILPKSCVFEMSNEGAARQKTVKNKGNATVRGWNISKNKMLFAAHGITTNGVADSSGARISAGGSLTILSDIVSITNIDVGLSAVEEANVAIELYVVMGDTMEKLKSVEETIIVNSDTTYTIPGQTITWVEDNRYFYSDYSNIELVITTDKEITVKNPVITYVE